jgi:hypothetical protein
VNGGGPTGRPRFCDHHAVKIPWWQVLRVILVVGWVAWAGLTWWAAPRQASVEHARADLAANRIDTYEWGDSWRSLSGLLAPEGARLQSSGDVGPIFLWRTLDGQTHYTTITEHPEAFDAEVVAHNRDDAYSRQSWVRTVLIGLSIAGALLILWALVSAPDPVRGTRWFWWWVLVITPIGAGLLWWLATERPWSARATLPPAPPGPDKRRKWYVGFGLAILAGWTISLAYWGLHWLLGDGLIPRPD